MDRYQGKNLDRYQEEIRRAAAKGVKDLNLSGSLTPNMSATSASPVGRALPRKLSSSSVGTSNSEVQGRNRNLSDTNIGQTSISVSAAAARIEHLQRLNQINFKLEDIPEMNFFKNIAMVSPENFDIKKLKDKTVTKN